MIEGPACDRCQGSGVLTDLSHGESKGCHVCLGLGRYVRRPSRPENPEHLIALHSTVLDFDEVVMMLPVKEEDDE